MEILIWVGDISAKSYLGHLKFPMTLILILRKSIPRTGLWAHGHVKELTFHLEEAKFSRKKKKKKKLFMAKTNTARKRD